MFQITEFDGKGLNYYLKNVDLSDYIFVKKKHVKVLQIKMMEILKNRKQSGIYQHIFYQQKH